MDDSKNHSSSYFRSHLSGFQSFDGYFWIIGILYKILFSGSLMVTFKEKLFQKELTKNEV